MIGAVRHGIDAHRGRLSGFELAAIRLVDVRREVDRRQIGQLENLRARPGAIAGFEFLRRAHAVARPVVRQDVDGAIGGRLDLKRRETARGQVDVGLDLVDLPLLRAEVGRGRGLVRGFLGLRFFQPLLRVQDEELGALDFRRRLRLRIGLIELRALDVVLRLDHGGMVLLGVDLRLLRRLIELGLRLSQLGLLVLQRAAQRQRVEVGDDVALLDGRAVGRRASGSAARRPDTAR